MTNKTTDTRLRLLTVATRVFAERGFYGTSIADVAEELNVTKQALLYHFGKKERLYVEVLKRISEEFTTGVSEFAEREGEPIKIIEDLFQHMFDRASKQPDAMLLISRELMDNRRRENKVETWYLKPYLDSMVELLRRVPGCQTLDKSLLLTFVYSQIGAMQYMVISNTTLQGIYSKKVAKEMKTNFVRLQKTQIQSFFREIAVQ